MTDTLKNLPWLKSSWSQLESYIKQERVPQALLIVGKKGGGKSQLAEIFTQSLLCVSPLPSGLSCGTCQSCTLFKAKTHPDSINIAPEEVGKVIGIDIIRQLTAKLALKPQFESYRVVVINPADSLNNASANAFLKYLEEPTERTCLILITDKPAKLPATIRSRCQKLYVPIAEEKLAKNWLKQQGVVNDIDLLLSLSQGAPLLAKQLADNLVVDFRLGCFKQWNKVVLSEESCISIAEQWSKLDKNEMELLLSCLLSWVMDIIKLKCYPQIERIVNNDLLMYLQQLADKLDLKLLYKYYDFLLLRRQQLDTQLNKQLMFEEILIQCSKLIRG